MPVSCIYVGRDRRTGESQRLESHFKSHQEAAETLAKWNRNQENHEYIIESIDRIDKVEKACEWPQRVRDRGKIITLPAIHTLVAKGRRIGEVSKKCDIYEYEGKLYRLLASASASEQAAFEVCYIGPAYI